MSFNLNKDQQKAVAYDGVKPLLIQAGPGAGKTRVIVERVKFLIKDKKVNPESILVITFTHKAAEELKERIAHDKDIDISTVNKMQISTIHSFCFKVLSEFGISGLNILDDDKDEKQNMFIRKHKKELGFEYESYLSGSQIDSVISKFSEYATFKVNTPKLVNYIRNNRPVSRNYINFINQAINESDVFEFPYDEVRGNDEYKKSWYNAKYLAIAKAYPIYLELLKKEETSDFNQLQIKTMNLLKDESILNKIRFKNILIDEFQDTDPIQMEIFRSLLGISESFTVVGDDDQSIYGFRGSVPQFFTEFSKNFDSEVISLDTNYRSIPEIVSFNENLIKDSRALKKDLKANRMDESPVYYVNNVSKDEEAKNIVKIIKHLKAAGKITQYSDVGILYRSLFSGKKLKVSKLLQELKINNINYTIYDNPNLLEHDEIKAVITLLWYMKKDKDPLISSGWEKDWLNYKAFTDEIYGYNFFNLSESTMYVLRKIEDDFQEQAIQKEHEIYERLNNKKSRIRKYSGVLKRPKEVLEEIFSEVRKVDISMMDVGQLKSIGITDEGDLEFFDKLNAIKRNFYDKKHDFYHRPTILETYYDLINLVGLVEDNYSDESKYGKQVMLNLASLTSTMFNYETMIYKYDINGLFWYLSQNLERYSAPLLPQEDKVDSVQIMTIHKSKGLEFPVAIVGSIEDGKFPKAYKEYDEIPDYVAGKPTYHTPDNCLEYKLNQTEKQKKKAYEDEEKRILYVATTRAEDILILSIIAHEVEDNLYKLPEVLTDIGKTDTNLKEINPNNIKIENNLNVPAKKPMVERLNLSFTSFRQYNECPNKYNFIYNYHFKSSEDEYATFGLLVHSILNQLHKKSMETTVTENDVNKIIINSIENSINIKKDDEKLDEVVNSIKNYWNKYGQYYNTLSTELPFSIQREKYNLNGQIDLVVENDGNTITVIDFKTTRKAKVYKELSKHKQQLYMYVLALKENPEYGGYGINKAGVMAILDEELIEFEITDGELEEFKEKIDKTVQNIFDGKYYRITTRCSQCEFNDTLCKNLED